MSVGDTWREEAEMERLGERTEEAKKERAGRGGADRW